MNGPEHYREAERCLALVANNGTDGERAASLAECSTVVAIAQVHATLALAAATAEACPEDAIMRGAWSRAIAGVNP